jgi:hypothetical protein
MGSDHGNGIFFGIGLTFGLIAGSVLSAGVSEMAWRASTVRRGCAEYNRQTGAWQWVETEKKGGEE